MPSFWSNLKFCHLVKTCLFTKQLNSGLVYIKNIALPHMPILVSSNSVANKHMMSKILKTAIQFSD